MSTHLLDVEVWAHALLSGHETYTRGLFPNRVWRCARHDCDWMYAEGKT